VRYLEWKIELSQSQKYLNHSQYKDNLFSYTAESHRIKVSERGSSTGKSEAWLGRIGNPSVDRLDGRSGGDFGGLTFGHLLGHSEATDRDRTTGSGHKGAHGRCTGGKDSKRNLHGK